MTGRAERAIARERTAVLIVGGGPAGSAAAITLARGGAAPLLLERHAEPHDALCGGFVSWRTRAQLDALGVDRDALGGHPITRLTLFAGKRKAQAALPAEAIGLSRARLDEVLRDTAARAGAAIETGVSVRTVENGAARLGDGGEIGFDALFLATGKTELRGLARPVDADHEWMGLRFRYAATPGLTKAVAGAIELHLFDGGYAGLLLQEDGSANLCMALRRDRLAAAGGDPDMLLEKLAAEAPSLGERLDQAEALVARDAVGLVPYGWRARSGAAGLFRLGDQAAVIPSLAGEGIGIALASGRAAAERYLAGGAAAGTDWQHDFARRVVRPLAVAGAIAGAATRPICAPLLLALARVPGLAESAARLTRIA